MNRQRPAILLYTLTLAAGISLAPLYADTVADGTTGDGAIRYLSQSTTWTTNHSYDDWGIHSSLCVGTGAGEGHLSVQEGARVEIPGALFIGGKGYNSAYQIEDGHDGLVTIGPGSVLECGSQTTSASTGQVYVGWGSGVKGTLRVNGGELISNHIFRVGCHEASEGLMEVLGGGRVTLGLGSQIADSDASFLSIATDPGSKGVLRVAEGSTLAFAVNPDERTRADIGTAGQGTLIVEGGSFVSLGQDYALIGVESGSQGNVHVRGGSTLELPLTTYMARAVGSQGHVLVEGQGSRLVGEDISVGEAGEASFTVQDAATADLSGLMTVGTGTGTGRVGVHSGARLATAGMVEVGSRGSMQLADGGHWVSSAPVTVRGGGSVSMSGQSRWEAQAGADFQSGSTLAFTVESAARVPEIAVAAGAALTMSPGSHLRLTLSPELLEAAAYGLELPLITGEFVGEGYRYELLDPSGLLQMGGMERLSDGRWGLRTTLNRPVLRRMLADDAARLANGLWSSTGVVQDFGSSLLDRPDRGCGRQLWGMGLGSFSHMSSQAGSPGYDFNGGGYAVGADTCLENGRSSLGVSFGQIFGNNKSGMTRIHQRSLMGALYARHDSHSGEAGRRTVLDAYAAYGRVHNSARSSMFSNGMERSRGRWSDDVFALGLRASWERPLTMNSSLLPFIGLRYLHGSHGAFSMFSSERGRGYSSSSMHNFSLPVGVTLRGRYSFSRRQELLPELTLAYVADLSRHNPHLSTSMLGESTRARAASPGRHAFMLSTGAAWLFNEHWSSGLYYHLECRDHEVAQSVDLSLGYQF